MVEERERSGVVFFFSSRRRHTRYWRDWSSDVCSSDLGRPSSATSSALPPLLRGSSTTTLSAATAHSVDALRSAAWHQPDGRVHLARSSRWRTNRWVALTWAGGQRCNLQVRAAAEATPARRGRFSGSPQVSPAILTLPRP